MIDQFPRPADALEPSHLGCGTQASATRYYSSVNEAKAATLTIGLLQDLFPEASSDGCAFRLWNGAHWPDSLPRPVRATVVLNHPGALRRMLLPPSEKNLGEAFVRGDFDVEGDLVACIGLADTLQAQLGRPIRWAGILRRLLALPSGRRTIDGWRGAARLDGDVHSVDRDRGAIAYHYDLPPEFYGLFLDRQMQYSCAYFKELTNSLDQAQEAKLAHIGRKLDLQPGEKVLDVGSGWGGLIAYLAGQYSVDATGITISHQQAEYARRRIAEAGLGDNCRVREIDYRDLPGDGGFDKLVSIAMIEAVGHKNLSLYFRHAYRLVKPGGRFLCHGIAGTFLPPMGIVASLVQRSVYATGSFINRYVFPDGEVLPLSVMTRAAEAEGFEVRDVESLREHYTLTLRHWVRNLEGRLSEALRLVDLPTYRVWRLYMAGCAYAFLRGQLNLYQILLVKRHGDGASGMPFTRDYMYPSP